MSDHKLTVVVDFDGVIASYDKWEGVDIFGEPILYAKEALLEFKEWGWQIIIWTTRRSTPKFIKYLESNEILYDAINSVDHNPPDTSNKPIAEVYIDDRSWYDVKRKFSWIRVMKRMRRLYQPKLDTYIDDASAWSCETNRVINWFWRQRRLWHYYSDQTMDYDTHLRYGE